MAKNKLTKKKIWTEWLSFTWWMRSHCHFLFLWSEKRESWSDARWPKTIRVGKNRYSVKYERIIICTHKSLFRILGQFCSNLGHLFVVNDNFDENGVVANIIQGVENIQLDKLLGSKTGIAFTNGSTQKWFVLFTSIRFYRVGDVSACFGVLALINQSESDPMGEGPREECVIFPFADTNKKRHVFATRCKIERREN